MISDMAGPSPTTRWLREKLKTCSDADSIHTRKDIDKSIANEYVKTTPSGGKTSKQSLTRFASHVRSFLSTRRSGL